MTHTVTYPVANPETASLNALLHTAVCVPLDDLSWLSVTGADRVRWLNGMVTNSIQSLAPGQGCFNLLLNAQGRIQETATAFALEDRLLLQTDLTQVDTLLNLLDRFIIMDDVELATAPRKGLALIGPEAPALLTRLGFTAAADPLTVTSTTWGGVPVDLIHAYSPLVPRFELWATPETIAVLVHALTETGAQSTTPDALKALRLLEGTPRFGTDIRETALPQEVNQPHALHFNKGCYLGQEIVERIRSRGQVHRTLHGFCLEGELPTADALLTANGKPVGELTSAAAIPLATGTINLALGMIRREALTAPITYPGGQAIPVTLPYAPAAQLLHPIP